MDTSISKKLNCVSLICLLLGTLVTAQALTPQELATFMQLANSGVAGSYVPLATLSAQFQAEATALKSWASELHGSGGDVKIQAAINQHKAQFFQPISLSVLEAKYKAAVAAGYKGTLDEFAKVLRGATVAERRAALTQMNQIGLYKVMLELAGIFAAASAQAAAMARGRGAHLVTASYYYFLLPAPACKELLWAGALFAYSGLLLDGLGIGLAFQLISVGVGVGYGYEC